MKLRKLLSLVLAAVMLLGCMTVTAVADDASATLDLESTATYSDKKEIEQNYTFTQTSESYTDVTKVKLDWTITDIAASYTNHKTWDPDTLTWVETKEDVSVTSDAASFTVTNYSSKAVIAKAEFAVEESLKDTFTDATFTNNECTVATPVVKDTTTTYTDADFTAKAQTITGTFTLKKDKFADLSAAASAAKYGTYTITISALSTVKSYSITNKFYYSTSADSANATKIEKDGSVTLKYTTGTGYPDVMFVENATLVSYDKTTGKLVISNPTGDVLVKDANLLTFTANTDGSTVTPNFVSGTWQYSKDDGEHWTDGDNNGTEIKLDNAGDSVLLKGTDCVTGKMSSGFLPFPTLTSASFSMTGSISAGGDVTSLTNGVGGDTALTDYCYVQMFQGCTSLTTAPSLPATDMAAYCYYYMFCGCTSLTTAPALSATTLAENCYGYMFCGCTSLTTAPALPATDMAAYCYSYMFGDCVKLAEAPVLSSENLAAYCYESMFGGCESLTVAPTLPATNLAEGCYHYMFQNCTGFTAAPELKSTSLAAFCYQSMFAGCTNLTSAPELPATTLVSSCYDNMFFNCTSLKYTTDENKAGATKIFTCTTDNANNEVTWMFGQNSSEPNVTVTPENGTTYYWYTE